MGKKLSYFAMGALPLSLMGGYSSFTYIDRFAPEPTAIVAEAEELYSELRIISNTPNSISLKNEELGLKARLNDIETSEGYTEQRNQYYEDRETFGYQKVSVQIGSFVFLLAGIVSLAMNSSSVKDRKHKIKI